MAKNTVIANETATKDAPIVAPIAAAKKAPTTKKAEKVIEPVEYQTYAMTPTSGKLLWALTHCVLELNGQYAKRPFIPKGNIVNFFSSSTILRHHMKNGNFEENEKGFVRLTVQGLNYFKSRVNGQHPSQQLTPKDVEQCFEVLKGKPIKNKTRTIKIMPI